LEYRADASNLYKYMSGDAPATMTQLNQTLTYAVMYGF
jgi:hypothetical protein